MSNFHDVAAPLFLSFYARRNNYASTNVLSTISNYEHRFNYSGTINKYSFENARISLLELNILKKFFSDRNGCMFSFWFLDYGIKKKVRFNNDFIDYKVNIDGSLSIKNLEIVEVQDE